MNTRNIGYYILNEAAEPIVDTKIVSDGINKFKTNKLGNRVIAEGTLQSLGKENRNKRIYLAEDLVPELSAPRQRELFRAGEMKGECGYF